MRATLVSVSLLALCSIPGLAATTKLADSSPVRRLPAPEDVSPQAQRAVRTLLGQHATSMQNLVRAVVLLDRPTIKVLADRIAGEQPFAPPRESGPSIFFQIRGEGWAFAEAARELSFVASTSRSNALLADRFAALTRICVTCHSRYLHGPRKRNPIDWDDAPLDEQPNGASSQSPQPTPP